MRTLRNPFPQILGVHSLPKMKVGLGDKEFGGYVLLQRLGTIWI